MDLNRLLAGTLVAGGLLGATALASEPSSGTVSKSTPKVEWSGTTAGSYAARIPVAVTENDSIPCQAPACDTFALTVADQANLTIGANLVSDPQGKIAGTVTLRIRKPDGSTIYATSPENDISEEKYFTVQIKNAPTGGYTVEHWNNDPLPETKYSGFAELPAFKAAAPAPAAGPAPGAPGGQPVPPAPVPGASVQAIELQVKAGKASARKMKKSRKLAATISVSREVTSVTATLTKGKKVIGNAKLGTTSGTKNLTLKIAKSAAKKLKKGKYKLNVAVTDGKTSTSKTISVNVGR